MPREPKRSGFVRTGSSKSGPRESDPGPGATPQTEAKQGTENQSHNVDELVSNFLMELNQISGVPAPSQEPAVEVQGPLDTDEQAVPLQSKADTADLDRELAETLDELDRQQSKSAPPVPPAPRIQPAIPAPPKSDRPAAPAPQHSKPAVAAKHTVAHETLPAAKPAAAPEAKRPPQVALLAAQTRRERRPIRTVGWIAAVLVLIAGVGITYRIKQPRTAQIPAAPNQAAASSTPSPLVPLPQQVKQNPTSVETQASAPAQEEHAAAPPRGVAESAPASKGRSVPPSAVQVEPANSRPAVETSARQAPTQKSPVQSSPAPAAAAPVAAPPPATPAPAATSSAPTPAASDNGRGAGTPATHPASTAAAPATTPASANPAPAPPVAAASEPVPPPVEKKAPETADAGRAAPPPSSAAAPEPAKPAPPPVYKAPTTAVVVRKVLPEYSALARRVRAWGTVELNVDVNEKGDVVRAVAISGPAVLRPAAIEAMKKWQFKPATQNGVNIPSTVKISVAFDPGNLPEHK